MNVECYYRQKRPRLEYDKDLTIHNERSTKTEESKPLSNLTGISPSERLCSMYETGLYSDCTFLIEDQEVKAHRLVLALASPYLEKLLLGPEKPEEPIKLPYSLRVMQLVLKHCYLQDMDIESIDEAQDVIEVASCFEMKDLVELCCAGIEPTTLDDLWPALNLACVYKSRALKESCLSLALKNSNTILNHDGLLQLSPEAFSFLLSREVIQVETEKEIVDVAIAWAQNRLETLYVTEINLRQELENSGVLKNLRILALPENDFITFLTGNAKEVFNDEELEKLEYNYFSDTCEIYISPLRTERMLEQRIPICGYDYLAVNSDKYNQIVEVRVNELPNGVRPILKTIILPSQINPANVLYDNVSHRTHYDECILIEVSVNNIVVSRGSFYDRVKYGDDININLNTFNHTPLYANNKYDELGYGERYYEAKINIMFRTNGYYPLAVETKAQIYAPLVLKDPCRLIHEFVLASPKM